MRQAVLTGGIDSAAEAFLVAHEVATLSVGSVSDRLSAFGGMAGDDSTSAEFAGSYDPSAAEAVEALADIARAFVTMVRVTRLTAHHHRAAEAASAAGRPLDARADEKSSDSFVDPAPTTPPSSLGPSPESLGHVERWILGHLEGFFWPGADVECLHATAAVWRSAAADTVRLGDRCDLAVAAFDEQRSAEFPVAVAATEQLRGLVTDTAAHCVDLADTCDDYADAVEAARDRTRALLSEIAQMVVEGVAVSALVGLISAGTATGVAASAAAARVAAQSPRFAAVLATLRLSASGVSAKARTARTGLVDTRARLDKFLRVPARNDRGSMTLGGLAGRPRGWLKAHEVPPGHTLSDHVGKTADELLERCRELNIPRSSSFESDEEAARLIDKVLDLNRQKVAEWVASSPDKRLALTAQLGESTGVSVLRTGEYVSPEGVRVVLIPKPSMPEGWQILTAFPH